MHELLHKEDVRISSEALIQLPTPIGIFLHTWLALQAPFTSVLGCRLPTPTPTRHPITVNGAVRGEPMELFETRAQGAVSGKKVT